MAFKHVKKYYKQVQDQYLEMLDNVKDIDDAYKEGVMSKEQFDQAAQLLAQMKQNYDRLNYIIYLMYKPSRKEKSKCYDKQNKKINEYIRKNKATEDDIISENTNLLQDMKSILNMISKMESGESENE